MLEYRSSQLGSLLDAINNERLDEQQRAVPTSLAKTPPPPHTPRQRRKAGQENGPDTAHAQAMLDGLPPRAFQLARNRDVRLGGRRC